MWRCGEDVADLLVAVRSLLEHDNISSNALERLWRIGTGDVSLRGV